MKKVIILVLLFIASFVAYSQKGPTFDLGYVKNVEGAQKLILDHASVIKSPEVAQFLLDYPILMDLKSFKRSEKYSIINSALIAGSPVKSGKFIVITLSNGKKYWIKTKKRIVY